MRHSFSVARRDQVLSEDIRYKIIADYEGEITSSEAAEIL